MFNVGIIRINFKLLLIKSNFFFEICDIKFWQFCLLFTFILNLHFSSNKNCQVRKIQNQKNILVVKLGAGGGGESNYLNPKFQQIKFLLLLKKKINVKYILTSL